MIGNSPNKRTYHKDTTDHNQRLRMRERRLLSFLQGDSNVRARWIRENYNHLNLSGNERYLVDALDGDTTALERFIKSCRNLDVITRKLLFGSASPSPYEAEYQAVLDYGTSQGWTIPDTETQIAQNNFLLALKACNAWTKNDVIYVIGSGGDGNFARINWKAPGSFTLSLVNAPTYAKYRGYKGDGISAYLDTTWNAALHGTNYLLNSGNLTVYVHTPDFGGTNSVIGQRDAGNKSLITYVPGTPTVNAGMNTTLGGNCTFDIGSGLISIDRDGAASQKLYSNGVAVDTDVFASTSIVNANTYILAHNGPGFNYSKATVGFAAIGGSLLATEHADLSDAVNTYMAFLAVKDVLQVSSDAGYTGPVEGEQAIIEDHIYNLMTDGIWWEMDIYVISCTTGDANHARYNYRNPSEFIPTLVNAPAFTAKEGFRGDGVSAYIDTNYTLSTSARRLTATAGTIINKLTYPINFSQHAHAVNDTVSTYYLRMFRNGGTLRAWWSVAPNTTHVSGVDVAGNFVQYVDGANSYLWYDGTEVGGNLTQAGFAHPALNLLIFCRNIDGVPGSYSTAGTAVYAVGGNTRSKGVELSNHLNSLYTAISAL